MIAICDGTLSLDFSIKRTYNLNHALNTHWVYLTAAVNLLEEQEPDTIQKATSYIGWLERLLETELYSSRLILLDSQGNCYDDTGNRGVWSDVSVLASGEDQYTFISESPIYQGSYWNFVQKLDVPIHVNEDDVSFTHVALLKDVRTLTQYYDSAAYGGQNETYILKSDGTRMSDLSEDSMIQSYNVLKVLEGMEGQRYSDIRAALEQTDTLSSNFIYNGVEYYYCTTSLSSYDTLLLFLIPAQFVAAETVKMVSAVIQTLLLLAAVLLVLLVLAVTAVLRHRSSARMVLQEQANLRRQEELNARLEDSNAQLAKSKAAAEQALQIAEAANKAKSAFLGNVSHDIRTPMNAIIRPQAKAKDQTFDIFVSPLTYEQVQGDKLRINQILINLLSNSVKYTPVGGKIQMRVEELPQVMKKHSRIRFTVSDNGMGMSEEYLKVIFDPFTREETQATYGIQGTGLGMAITKSLVDLMGGSIKVASKLGEGSTFTVELGLRIQEREDDPKFWEDCGLKRMLVADDEEAACQSIVRLMSQTGVEVEYATGGESAFDLLCSAHQGGHPYDVILLDWKMPQLDGLGTARLIRERYPEKIPILLLTAYDWSDIEEEAKEIGIRHFMPKPFFMSTFKNAIGRVMDDVNKKKEKEKNDDVVRDKHILVVDDIEVNRIILVKILSTLGAACDTACNGQEAVDRFEASQPGDYDLILMDVQMPVMNGYEATRTIRASEHPSAGAIPIIAMTANAFVDDVRDAIESGMDAHIAKPVQIDNLKSTIRQVLDSRLKQLEEPEKA